MSFYDVRTKKRWYAALALAVAFGVLVIGAQWVRQGTDVPPPHPHSSATAAHSAPTVITEHAHLQDGSMPVMPDTLSHAVLPRTTTTLVALALVATIATVAALWSEAPLAAVRGPPRPLAGVLPGRLMLTRHCIARS